MEPLAFWMHDDDGAREARDSNGSHDPDVPASQRPERTRVPACAPNVASAQILTVASAEAEARRRSGERASESSELHAYAGRAPAERRARASVLGGEPRGEALG